MFTILKSFLKFITFSGFGDSMNYLGKPYTREPRVKCYINDEVIIHPTDTSIAKTPYPGKIVAEQVKGKDGEAEGSNIWVLTVKGTGQNYTWSTWMNEYLFNRLEFVKRKKSWLKR